MQSKMTNKSWSDHPIKWGFWSLVDIPLHQLCDTSIIESPMVSVPITSNSCNQGPCCTWKIKLKTQKTWNTSRNLGVWPSQFDSPTTFFLVSRLVFRTHLGTLALCTVAVGDRTFDKTHFRTTQLDLPNSKFKLQWFTYSIYPSELEGLNPIKHWQ